MAAHSSILAWRIPCRGAWPATVRGVSQRGTALSMRAQDVNEELSELVDGFRRVALNPEGTRTGGRKQLAQVHK